MTREVQYAIGTIHRVTGHQYRALEAALEALSPEAQRDLQRLAHDIEDATRMAERAGERRVMRRGF